MFQLIATDLERIHGDTVILYYGAADYSIALSWQSIASRYISVMV
jgi:predicted GH43/DUF377 family glycosyl hydrolase